MLIKCKIKILNMLILQWFGIRLQKTIIKRVVDYKLMGFDMMPDGHVSSRGMGNIKEEVEYKFKFWVKPFTDL
jgi:hypothetical protein